MDSSSADRLSTDCYSIAIAGLSIFSNIAIDGVSCDGAVGMVLVVNIHDMQIYDRNDDLPSALKSHLRIFHTLNECRIYNGAFCAQTTINIYCWAYYLDI
jgi:hypothetical protein